MTTLAPRVTPLIDLDELGMKVDDLWEQPQARRSWRERLDPVMPRPEIAILTVAALALYVFVAYYLHYTMHFWINDELNRTTDAVYVSISRDPHLGAIGFYWPPLAQLIQIPFVLVLNPFGQTIMAGPVSSAVAMALTIPVLAGIARTTKLGRPTTFGICAVFALNPLIVYYSANGMSEACFFLAGSVMLWGFLAYVQDRSIRSILLFALGASAVAMTRLEGPVLVAAMVVVATFNIRHLKRSVWDTFVLGAPPLAFFGFWIAVQWILLGDPLFFLHQNGGGAPPTPGTAAWLPNTRSNPNAAYPWAFHWVWVLGPALIAVAATLIAGPLSKRTRGTIGIVAGMGVFLAIQIDQVIKGSGYGDPRYFVTAILFATVGAIWVASRKLRPWTPVWNLGLIAVLALSGATGNWELTSARLTSVEHECVFFEQVVARHIPILGRQPAAKSNCHGPSDGLTPWATTTHWLDARLTPTDRVLTDNAEIPQPDLFTAHSNQYIVENDSDWHKTTSNPYFVTYIITQSRSLEGRPDLGNADVGADLVNHNPDLWKLVRSADKAYDITHAFVTVQIYKYVGPPRTKTSYPSGLNF